METLDLENIDWDITTQPARRGRFRESRRSGAGQAARPRRVGQAGTGLSLLAFPYGTPITLELLRQVDRAERAVHDAGIRVCRVRHHGEVARIEIPLDEVAAIVAGGVASAWSQACGPPATATSRSIWAGTSRAT